MCNRSLFSLSRWPSVYSFALSKACSYRRALAGVQVIVRGVVRLDCLALRRELPGESRTRRCSVPMPLEYPFLVVFCRRTRRGRSSTKKLWCCSQSFKLQEGAANPVLFFGQLLLKGSEGTEPQFLNSHQPVESLSDG
ncbi:hypothetical protein BJ508DRAFT_143736 [Ascobolus immersus RN42]|uniref:Uncharacterized protein n=1 Tax=Ascobolus immersus RN42 TaxID=1160509 RepID=A0A3N4HZK3_ASCIM|nr:hypothetical protein BJ508DRAFT_143736 [Ascobolus immersus RN42]